MAEASRERTLQRMFHEAVAQRDVVVAEAEPLRKRRAELQEQIRPAEEEILAITDQIRSIEHPRLIDAMNECAQIARALKPNPDHPVARTGPPPEPEVAEARRRSK